MILIDNQNVTEPHINLAIEEYVAENMLLDEPYLFFYTNKPSIIVGKNQNTMEEVNLQFARKRQIAIVRRISGGGTVYHDEGNLNYSIISAFNKSDVGNWKKIGAPILQSLQMLEIPAEFNYRNDIVVGGKKVSGTAQYTSKKAIISHGTLLYNANIDNLDHAITPDSAIQSKSLKSVRSKVANLIDYMPERLPMRRFRDAMIVNILGEPHQITIHRFSREEWAKINQLAEQKYLSWEWTFGKSPAYTLERVGLLPKGKVVIQAKIQKGGIIEEISIRGNNKKNYAEMEEKLVGVLFEPTAVRKALTNVVVTSFADLEVKRILSTIC